jgi:mono/diheme cytochrome c family protein
LRSTCVLAIALTATTAAGAGSARADEEKVDFARAILPIFQGACVDCHGLEKASGGLRLTSGSRLLEGGISGKALVPGQPAESYLLARLRGQGGEARMPLKGEALTRGELAVIERWIKEGAVVPPDPPTVFVPAPGGIKRLTAVQYRNTVRELLGEGIAVPAGLEADMQVSGSAAVGAGRIFTSRTATEKYGRAAFTMARQALASAEWRKRWIPCQPGPQWDEACAGAFLDGFGRRAWRRPLDDDERERYLGLARSATAAGHQLASGLEAVVAALLQSPSFLYRTETGEPDPSDPSRRVLTGYEMASRLSYFLWGAPPDDALLLAAADGRLGTQEGLAAEAERMLRSPRARGTVETFFIELLRLDKLDHLPQFEEAYKEAASRTLGRAMRTETLKVVDEIALSDRDFREIFDTPFTYLDAELARLYGMPAPAVPWQRVEADPRRAGVLGQASFLALNAHPTAPSPTKRGRFIRQFLLCQPVPPPPPDVSTKLPKDDGGAHRTTRQKLTVHRKAAQCAGCHKAMDPLGLAFEIFDGIGAYRARDQGVEIDSSGELDGQSFENPAELGQLLRRDPKVGVCVARSLYRFAVGRLEGEGEEPLVDDLAADLERDGYRFLSLVQSVVKSRGFRYLSAP